MSLFDGPHQQNLAEAFPPGTPFRLCEAWIEGQARTSTGAVRTLAKVVVSPVTDEPNEAEFGVWGSLADQVRAIEPGELPAIVTLDNSSGLWCFAAHGPAAQSAAEPGSEPEGEQPLAAVPEAHLDLEGGDSEAPPPVPDAAAPVGTDLDESQAVTTPLPTAAAPKGTELDESQVFQPGAAGPESV